MRPIRYAVIAAAFTLAGAAPAAAHVPHHCLEHSIRAEEGMEAYSDELATMQGLSRAIANNLESAELATDWSSAIDVLERFFKGQLPDFLVAVQRANRLASQAMEASANTVLCAHGIE